MANQWEPERTAPQLERCIRCGMTWYLFGDRGDERHCPQCRPLVPLEAAVERLIAATDRLAEEIGRWREERQADSAAESRDEGEES